MIDTITIEELSQKIFDNMGEFNQITIDYVQEVQALLNEETPTSTLTKQQNITAIGALSYDIDVLLDVFNPEFKKQISVLKGCEKLLNERKEAINILSF